MAVTPRAKIDFETRSAISLKTHGTWVYSLHPSTEVLCMAFRLPHWKSGRTALWHPNIVAKGLLLPRQTWRDLEELFRWIEQGGLVEAHNAWFEYCIWAHKMVAGYSWPAIPATAWRCSAAKAASVALPRDLDDALAAIGLALRKDAEGSKVMKKMTKPRKPRKKERERWATVHGDAPHDTLYWEDWQLLQDLFAYCRQDIVAEDGLSYIVPDLSSEETDLFLLDQRINARGFQLDMDAVATALRLLKQEAGDLNTELAGLTDGRITKATQREKILAWLDEQGVQLENTQAQYLDEIMASGMYMPAEARRVIEIMRTLGRSSTAKYLTMQAWADPTDGRVRGGLLFHGATTGRWTGKGVQPHNFPKGSLKNVDMDALWRDLKTLTRHELRKKYKSVMEALSHALRGAIVAGPGTELFVADFASIEARVLMWLAGDEEALEIFRTGKDIYCDMASEIYGYPVNKADHAKERGIGKIAILGLGYQMGASKFVVTCEKGGVVIDEEFSKQVVEAYRRKYWRVKQLWADQEAAAIEAVRTGQVIDCGAVTWEPTKAFLFCYLPSGRRLAYPSPRVSEERTSWGALKQTLTYMGVDSYTHKWTRQKTYGGMIVENITQAVARDLLAEAMQRCEASQVYLPVLSVHDEIVAEAPLGVGTLGAFMKLMKKVPKWAYGCPIDADAWQGTRYHK